MIYFYSVDKPTDTQLSSSSEPVEEGKSLVITCTARANPSAEYKFYRDNKLISSSSTGVLSFVSAKNDDQGTYRCVPHNILGEGPQATLTVTVKGMYMKIAQLRLPKLGMGYSGKSLYCSFSWAMGVRAMSQYQWVDIPCMHTGLCMLSLHKRSTLIVLFMHIVISQEQLLRSCLIL